MPEKYLPGSYLFTLSIGLGGTRQETVDVPEVFAMDNGEWECLSRDEQEKLLDEEWQEWAWNYIDGGFESES